MKINVAHTAKLANLPLTDEEKNKFEHQLSAVLDYFKKLEEVNTENILSTSQTTGLENITAPDIVKKSLTHQEVMQNKKETHNGFFKVKGVFDNE